MNQTAQHKQKPTSGRSEENGRTEMSEQVNVDLNTMRRLQPESTLVLVKRRLTTTRKLSRVGSECVADTATKNTGTQRR